MIIEGNKIKCGQNGTWHIFDVEDDTPNVTMNWNSLERTGCITYDDGSSIYFAYDSFDDAIYFGKKTKPDNQTSQPH